MNLNISCVYKIVCNKNNKVYIGSAVNFRKRKNDHLRELKQGVHANKALQNAFNKYTEKYFNFIVLEICKDKTSLVDTEQKWIDFYKSNNRKLGFNIRKIARSNLGVKFSEKTRKKLSTIHKGRKFTLEHRNKIAAALRGKAKTEAHKNNLAKANTGKKASESTRAKMRASRKLYNESISSYRA